MAMVSPAVDAYLAGLPAAQRRILKRVRTVIRQAVPAVTEGISYGIPTFKVGGKVVVYFAGWKQHFAVYPISAGVATTLAKEMAPYEQSNRGTIRFDYDAPLPVHLIARIAKLRAAEAAAGTAQSITKARASKATTRTTTSRKPAARTKQASATKARTRPRAKATARRRT